MEPLRATVRANPRPRSHPPPPRPARAPLPSSAATHPAYAVSALALRLPPGAARARVPARACASLRPRRPRLAQLRARNGARAGRRARMPWAMGAEGGGRGGGGGERGERGGGEDQDGEDQGVEHKGGERQGAEDQGGGRARGERGDGERQDAFVAPEVEWSKRKDPAEDYKDWDEEDRELFLELDKYANEWIGTNLSRLYFYEDLKAKRAKLQKLVVQQEEEVQGELAELRDVLGQLEALLDVRLLDKDTGDIGPGGWAVVGVSALANVAVVVVIYQVLLKVYQAVLPASPF